MRTLRLICQQLQVRKEEKATTTTTTTNFAGKLKILDIMYGEVIREAALRYSITNRTSKHKNCLYKYDIYYLPMLGFDFQNLENSPVLLWSALALPTSSSSMDIVFCDKKDGTRDILFP